MRFGKLVVFGLLCALALPFLADDASAFRIGKWRFFEGQVVDKPQQGDEELPAESLQINKAADDCFVGEDCGKQGRGYDVQKIVGAANADSRVKTYTAKFRGKRFCVEVDELFHYVEIKEDGSIAVLSERPDRCYRVRSSEEFVVRAFGEAQSGGYVSAEDVLSNVDVGWRLKARLVVLRVRGFVGGAFS